MIVLKNSACIEAPVEQVWAVLADLESVHLWVGPIRSARCAGEKNRGLGASRVCELSGGVFVTESWTNWVEGSSYEYDASGMPVIERASNRWTVQPEGDRTLVISEAEIVVKGGFFGRLLEPVLRPMMKGLGPRTLASLKYYVERGTPYRGNHKELPLPPIFC